MARMRSFSSTTATSLAAVLPAAVLLLLMKAIFRPSSSRASRYSSSTWTTHKYKSAVQSHVDAALGQFTAHTTGFLALTPPHTGALWTLLLRCQ